MPRADRAVCAGISPHITQRGHRREDVFFTDEDRQAYLEGRPEYAAFVVQVISNFGV